MYPNKNTKNNKKGAGLHVEVMCVITLNCNGLWLAGKHMK